MKPSTPEQLARRGQKAGPGGSVWCVQCGQARAMVGRTDCRICRPRTKQVRVITPEQRERYGASGRERRRRRTTWIPNSYMGSI